MVVNPANVDVIVGPGMKVTVAAGPVSPAFSEIEHDTVYIVPVAMPNVTGGAATVDVDVPGVIATLYASPE